MFDQQFEARFKELTAATQDAALAAARANNALAAIHGSFAYRCTAPIRWVEQQLEQLNEDGISVRLSAFNDKIRRLLLHRARALVNGRRGLSRVQNYLDTAIQRQAQVAAERQAALAEKLKIPLDPAIVQQAYQTRARLETVNPEAQAIYEQLRRAAKADEQATK